MQNNLPLTMAQIKADIFLVEAAIAEAEKLSSKDAKYIKGQAGYHLQQAAEKLIKIQLYASGQNLNPAKIYKHKLYELIAYAASIGAKLIVPSYIDKNAAVISDWEAEGRYDIHVVVKITQLKKCSEEINAWYDQLLKDGYR